MSCVRVVVSITRKPSVKTGAAGEAHLKIFSLMSTFSEAASTMKSASWSLATSVEMAMRDLVS